MVEINKTDFDAMNKEIIEKSENIWNETLTDTDEGIKLVTLFTILDKYIKPREEDKPKS